MVAMVFGVVARVFLLLPGHAVWLLGLYCS